MNRNIRIRQSIAEGILGTPLYLGFLSYVLEALRRCLSAKQKYAKITASAAPRNALGQSG